MINSQEAIEIFASMAKAKRLMRRVGVPETECPELKKIFSAINSRKRSGGELLTIRELARWTKKKMPHVHKICQASPDIGVRAYSDGFVVIEKVADYKVNGIWDIEDESN